MAPVVLGGNVRHFVESAELCRGTRFYFSSSISEKAPPNKDTVRFAKYILELYSHHYFPGFPAEDFADLDVLHPKTSSWDGHKMVALNHLKTGKTLRPFRYAADYFRFAWLTSLINYHFNLEDPLDPKNCRPCIIRERAYGKKPPQSLAELEEEIRVRVLARRIQSREEIVRLLSDVSVKIEIRPHYISTRIDDTSWHLEGFAASAKFKSLPAWERYLEQYSKPFRDVQINPKATAERVRQKFMETVQENTKRYDIHVEMPPDGFVIPSPEFFANYGGFLNEISLPIDNEKARKYHSSEIVQLTGHSRDRDFARTENQVLGVIEPDPGIGESHRDAREKHLGKAHRIGTKDHQPEDIFPHVTGSHPQGTASPPRVDRAVKRYTDYTKNCLQEIEWIAAHVLRLLAISPLLRKLGFVRKPRWRNPKLRPSNEIARSLSSSPFLKQIRLSSAQQTVIQYARRPRNNMDSPILQPTRRS